MAKPTTGKAWFVALGRRHASKDRQMPLLEQQTWPQWARDAYWRGHLHQSWRRA